MERISRKNIVSDPASIYFAPRRVVRPNAISQAAFDAGAANITIKQTSDIVRGSKYFKYCILAL